MPSVIAAIDQGTTSTRCILFNRDGPVASHQLEHKQIYPQPGWVEHDPLEIWRRTCETITGALAGAKLSGSDVAAIGIANQRETTVVWNKQTGKPYSNAIVWQDTRTRELCHQIGNGNLERFRNQVGLPLATYFSGPKLRWLLENDSQLRRDAERGEALFGTIDTWLIWNLTGGLHVTDVTNASRTMLMNLHTLDWDDAILAIMQVPRAMLPKIVPCNGRDVFGVTRRDGPLGAAIPIGGVLGDQQAALVGHACFDAGEMKNTYGTGCFMLLNTGAECVQSWHGLLSTVAYQFAGAKAVYALEGSVAVAGALVQWMRDNLGIIGGSNQIEALARSVPDNGGVYFVPAFSGLFAPWWRGDARGLVAGLSQHSNKGHLARAVLEATAYQTLDVLDAMRADANVAPKVLKADGGMTANELLMQFQADLLGVPVARSAILQTTALGAAYAAGLTVGFWSNLEELRSSARSDRTWQPAMEKRAREELHRQWLKAIQRSQGWLD